MLYTASGVGIFVRIWQKISYYIISCMLPHRPHGELVFALFSNVGIKSKSAN